MITSVSIQRLIPIIIVLSVAIHGCATVDFSTPEKNLTSLYQAIAKKDPILFTECYYTGRGAKISGLDQAAQDVFKHVTVIQHRIIRKEEVNPYFVNLTVEEISYREDGGKYASTFTVKYVKIGDEWKILGVENIETKKMDK
jgi:hypothetical protein